MARSLVVTLPPGLSPDEALAFARAARDRGADLLELRTDLHGGSDVPVDALARELKVLVAERSAPLPAEWIAAASVVDREEVPSGDGEVSLISHHAAHPMPPELAVQWWKRAHIGDRAMVKHVEPLGPLTSAGRLMETQRRLIREYGPGRVTVLATGASALPIRCVLSSSNELEYVAASPRWSAAVGQRLLEDAVRERRAPRTTTARLGILGTEISQSRSPRIHRQPFDRIDLPAEVDLDDLLRGLLPFYVGLAVTSPFKQAVADQLKSRLPAVNTLVRRVDGWEALNTDVDGARAVLQALGGDSVSVLGGGGASKAVALAAPGMGIQARVIRQQDVRSAPLEGAAVWTWPANVVPPSELRFARAKVAVIAYGASGTRIAREVLARGGIPLRLGPRWLIAQARRQRELWRSAGA